MMPFLHVNAGGPAWLDWALSPDVLILCIALELAYLYTVREMRPRLSDAYSVDQRQFVTFTLGIVVLYLAAGGPLHDIADGYLVSAHMLQHVLLMLVVAPLLLAGIPGWVWQALLRVPRVLPAARILVHPLFALAAFNGVFLLTHLPSAVDLQLGNGVFHLVVHVAQIGAGLLVWWPVLSTVPELPRISYPLQMGYLFIQSLLPAVFASFITFADVVVYEAYAETPRIWGINPINDQQIAGGIMKLLGSAVLWSFIVVVFFRWYAQEQAEDRELSSKDSEA